MFFMLYMLAAARRRLGRCDRGNHRQRRRVCTKHQKLDRNSALASFVRTVVQIALGQALSASSAEIMPPSLYARRKRVQANCRRRD